MHIASQSTWGRRLVTLATVSALSIAATVALAPLQPAAAQGATPPAPVVRGLPDFTDLVDQVGPSVVNIRTVEKVSQGARSGGQEEQMLEFFRRFGIPVPPGLTPRTPRAERDGEETERPRGVGSGFVLTADGFIMTNAHVVDGADQVLVTLPDKREFKARIIGFDKRSDVAVVKIEAAGLNAVKIGDVGRLRVGEWVMAIGSPFGLENSVTAGIVSAKQRDTGDYLPFIQTDVAINPGNSGGPLINMRGEVVGINSQIYSRSGGFQGISFAIPIDEAVRVSDQLRANGRVTRGRIGVAIDQVNKDVAESIGLGKAEGALVRTVEPNSPAAKAGVEPGDIVLRFDGKPVEKSVDLPRLVGNTKPGTRSTITVFRRGASKDLSIVVGEIEAERVAQRAEPRDNKAPVAAASKLLGLSVADLDDGAKAELKLQGGVRVVAVEGAAARAGLREDDVITAVANTEVRSVKDFEAIVAKADKSRPINVLFRRGDAASFVLIRPVASR